MKARSIPAAWQAMAIPSLNMWGHFWISSLSLKVPGSGAAPAAQPGGFKLGKHLLGRHRPCLGKRLVAAAGLVAGKRGKPLPVDPRQEKLWRLGELAGLLPRGGVGARPPGQGKLGKRLLAGKQAVDQLRRLPLLEGAD